MLGNFRELFAVKSELRLIPRTDGRDARSAGKGCGVGAAEQRLPHRPESRQCRSVGLSRRIPAPFERISSHPELIGPVLEGTGFCRIELAPLIRASPSGRGGASSIRQNRRLLTVGLRMPAHGRSGSTIVEGYDYLVWCQPMVWPATPLFSHYFNGRPV